MTPAGLNRLSRLNTGSQTATLAAAVDASIPSSTPAVGVPVTSLTPSSTNSGGRSGSEHHRTCRPQLAPAELVTSLALGVGEPTRRLVLQQPDQVLATGPVPRPPPNRNSRRSSEASGHAAGRSLRSAARFASLALFFSGAGLIVASGHAAGRSSWPWQHAWDSLFTAVHAPPA